MWNVLHGAESWSKDQNKRKGKGFSLISKSAWRISRFSTSDSDSACWNLPGDIFWGELVGIKASPRVSPYLKTHWFICYFRVLEKSFSVFCLRVLMWFRYSFRSIFRMTFRAQILENPFRTMVKPFKSWQKGKINQPVKQFVLKSDHGVVEAARPYRAL